jgi:excisionase family DNA binding protein
MTMEKLYIATEGDFLSLVRTAVREELANMVPVKADSNNLPPATRQGAAKYLGVSVHTLGQIIKSGELPAFYIGRMVRIKWADIEAYVNNKR